MIGSRLTGRSTDGSTDRSITRSIYGNIDRRKRCLVM